MLVSIRTYVTSVLILRTRYNTTVMRFMYNHIRCKSLFQSNHVKIIIRYYKNNSNDRQSCSRNKKCQGCVIYGPYVKVLRHFLDDILFKCPSTKFLNVQIVNKLNPKIHQVVNQLQILKTCHSKMRQCLYTVRTSIILNSQWTSF